ncbi:TrmB family transcriptional regulator [Methanoplanus sp. FWC-SCC4]|uniref:TrmB family transcriptional regulator n=1 Tax=Methanochimaera problematica TaxID=2609417 RepID=A0AA97FF50_9EURY|nr:helix-turn-helix domain-containing protein [Methanoplanus sp. FWC-SCC4]WOF17148.1 TrmB family transcriptional regulator [Methanoplanus sp. FWC-SCC4]
MEETAIETLKTLGLTEYEAKAYVAVVGLGMSTAREIHEKSGVPQGRIYSVLSSLVQKGYVEIQDGKPAYYHSDNPGVVINQARVHLKEAIEETENYLNNLHYDTKPPSPFWTIHSEWGIKSRFKTLIQNAEKEIIFFVSDPKVFLKYVNDIKKAKRKVDIEIYAEDKNDFAGTNLRINEFNERTHRFGEEMKIRSPDLETGIDVGFFAIIDESSGLLVGRLDEKPFGNLFRMPGFCFMLKSFMQTLNDNKY